MHSWLLNKLYRALKNWLESNLSELFRQTLYDDPNT